MTGRGYAVVTAVTAGLLAGLFGAVAWLAPRPRLLWNASASAPIGLYWLREERRPHVGDLVVLQTPEGEARLMAARGYLPADVPMLKHLAAGQGDRICRHGFMITINGRQTAQAREHDRKGRPLPVWQGCRTLRVGEIFALNRPADSFDSRYFGPIPAINVIAAAAPILTRDGPFGVLLGHVLGDNDDKLSATCKETSPCR